MGNPHPRAETGEAAVPAEAEKQGETAEARIAEAKIAEAKARIAEAEAKTAEAVAAKTVAEAKAAEAVAERVKAENQANEAEEGRAAAEAKATEAENALAEMEAMRAEEIERAAVLGIISQNFCMRQANVAPEMIRQLQTEVLASYAMTGPSFNAARAKYKTNPEFRKDVIAAQKNCEKDYSAYAVQKEPAPAKKRHKRRRKLPRRKSPR